MSANGLARRLAVTAAAALALPLAAAVPAQSEPTQSEPTQSEPTQSRPASSRVEHPHRPAPAVTVMTRNVYLGADIMRPIAAVQGLSDPLEIVQALGNATDATRDIVDATDFRVRARLLARELAGKRPDLVGLQEVALWRSGPLQLDEANLLVPNATEVDYDFLRMLRRELAARGVPYRPVSVNWLSDVEAPSFEGSLAAPVDPRDVRLTMRDVILKRVGSRVRVVRHAERQYAAGLELPIAGRAMNFTRGYQWVDLRGRAGSFRFLNTHLEAFSSDIALAQAQELVAGPGSHRRTTVLVCDCNSDPKNGSVKDVDTQPHWAAYRFLTRDARFVDTWLRWLPGWRGSTAGLSETVDDPDASGFDHRIDLVLARGTRKHPVRVVWGAVTGDETRDRDRRTGLWPSDHAGVVMRLRLR
jgi:endonuclease/exonuclease/phosphatase family metal-dependent hydrolase